MKYDDPDLLDALAAEYVVGTLRGASRRRFERLLRESVDARAAVSQWEALLGGLGRMVAAEPPPARVWQQIDSRIAGEPKPAGWWRSLRFWQVWGMGATAALVALAIAVSVPSPAPQPLPATGQVAVVENQQNQPMWVITINPAARSLSARAVNAQAAAVDRAYELWMLPKSGPPRSLGLLPVNGGVAHRQIPPGLLALLGQAQGLAISLEPAGGSPTGHATGPVLYQAPIVEL